MGSRGSGRESGRASPRSPETKTHAWYQITNGPTRTDNTNETMGMGQPMRRTKVAVACWISEAKPPERGDPKPRKKKLCEHASVCPLNSVQKNSDPSFWMHFGMCRSSLLRCNIREDAVNGEVRSRPPPPVPHPKRDPPRHHLVAC